MVEVEAREIDVDYDGDRVLSGVNVSVAAGEIVGVLGPNGSGKSTLVRVLSGVLRPARGTVLIRGAPIETMPRREVARRVAVVPQEPTFGFPFSVLQIILMGRHPHLGGLSFESEEDLRRAHAAMELCGVQELASRSIFDLSSGERQRVVFARALTQDPELLLLDEPASFLDIRYQVELYDRVRAMSQGQGTAVLTVLHDINLAAEYCDRLVLLKEGRVVSEGATDDVLTYANLRHVFDTEVYVDRNHLTGKLLVMPLSGRVVAGNIHHG